MIKKLTFSITLLFITLHAFSQGIEFNHSPWDELVKKAKELNKPIFVDMYTTWCGPCKVMDAKIFPRPEIGAKYNNGFINAKIDAEKGEGITIAKKYGVKAYPTYLFINPINESLIDQAVGSVAAADFNDLADKMLLKFSEKKEVSLAELEAKSKTGDYDGGFAQSYIKRLKAERKPVHEALEKYLDKFMANKPSTDQLYFLGLNYSSGAEDNVYNFVVTNYKAIDAVMCKNDGVAAASFDRVISSDVSRRIGKTMRNKQLSISEKETQLNKLYADLSLVQLDVSKRDKEILDAKSQFYRLNADTLHLEEVSRLYALKFLLPADKTGSIGREVMTLDKNTPVPVLLPDSSGAANWCAIYAVNLSRLSKDKRNKDIAKQLLEKALILDNSSYIKNMMNITMYNFGDKKKAIKQQTTLLTEMRNSNDEYLADAEKIIQKMKNDETMLMFFSYKMKSKKKS